MEFNDVSLSSSFFLAGIFIAFFSSFLLLGKRQKASADYILAIWFLIIAIHIAYFLLIFSAAYIRFPFLLGFEIALPLIHGPLLYLYIKSLTGQPTKRRNYLLHLIPAVMVYIILLKFFMLSPEKKIYIYQHNGDNYKSLRDNIKILIIFSGIVYVSLSSLALKKYKRQISELYSNTEKINLNWGYYLIAGIALIWIAVMLKVDILIFSLVVVFILVAAYLGISHVGILNLVQISNDAVEIDSEVNANLVAEKYQNNFVGKEVAQDIFARVDHLMEKEKVYKNPDLNLNQVAELVDVHPNVLSQTINYIANKNFYDYINGYRVEEFKRIAVLPKNQKLTIMSLAYESGFNSKTSFNRNFKKYTHCSPREFLKDQNIDPE